MESSAKSIVVFSGVNKETQEVEWYFTPRGGNHEVLAVSEGYTERNDAVEAAKALLPGVPLADELDVTENQE